ncbi:MAG: MBL fold metallo-hydrolase [Acidobacteria bacterium]|nr:MBL fold metallo-hydrolase [Acidobacteriota bacterium]
MNDARVFRCCLIIMLGVIMAATVVYGQGEFLEDIVKTSGGDLKITCIGHASLMFTFSGKVIHIDPTTMVYPDYASLPKADLVLVTHEHGDHMDVKAIDAIRTPDTKVVSNAASAKSISDAIIMKNGEKQTVAGISIEAVPAYNLEKPFHPKGNGNGYILTFGDKRIYVAGDTENVPEMKALKGIDVAFLPMNQPYTMTPEQVADAARAMMPRILYPYHYRFGETDTGKLVDLLKDEPGIEVRLRDLQ